MKISADLPTVGTTSFTPAMGNSIRTENVKDFGKMVYVPMASDVSSDMESTIGPPSPSW